MGIFAGLTVLGLMVKKSPKIQKFVHNKKQTFTYNYPMRLLMETYIEICFLGLLNATNGGVSNQSYFISTVVLAFVMLFGLPMPIYFINITGSYKARDMLDSEEFNSKFGTLTEEVKLTSPFHYNYYTIFMFHRFVFVGIIIFIYTVPYL